MKYIKGLDTLRAFAVLFVIVEHWWLPIDINDSNKTLIFWIKGLVPDGGFGVDLFFVLSGFLISSILIDAVKNQQGQKFKILKNFIVRRSLRIFPIYYLTIIILLIINYPFLKEHLIWFLTYTSNILSFKEQAFNNFSHTWSLAVEEQFYLIWPWFIIFVRPKYLKYVFVGAIFVGIFTSVYTMKIQNNWAGFLLMPSCMQAFGIGGLYAYYYRSSYSEKLFRYIDMAFPAALLAHFIFSFSLETSNQFKYCQITVNSLIAIWLIHKVVFNKRVWVQKYILENTLLNKIGQVSYGVYLFHYIMPFVYQLLVPKMFNTSTPFGVFIMDWKNAYFIRLALLAIFSLSSFYLFEKPVLKLKRYFEY